jgi:Holliday junction resolvase RusA-like endonuclease
VDKKSGKVIPEKRVGLFTKKDVSNLVKCVEDSVMDVVGIDDHHNVTVAMMKRKAPKEGVHIMLTAGEDNAVDTAILSLLDQMAGAHVP